jgi:tRNA A-37 threonylcarbamoyl transferase component Bud32
MTEHDPSAGDDLPPTLGPSGGPPPSDGGGLVGSVLSGRYRIVSLLGEGAMGSVYLGEHLKIGRRDAIKVLRDNLATDREAIARFVRGTRNVSLIRHPNICTIYDYSDTEDGLQFVAMEYVSGETLRDLLLREGSLPLERAIAIAVQVGNALQAAHEAGIVHRDLKPANIMVTPGRRGDDEIKVVDFDIAKGPTEAEGEEVTRHGFVVGTPEYMSPEQLIGERLDGRSDVYSLALVLFRMITGELPFRGQGAQDLMVKRLTEEPMRLGDLLPDGAFPPTLDVAIARALSRNPADRQADAEEFAAEIARAIGGGPVPDPARREDGARAAPLVARRDAGTPLPATAVQDAARDATPDRRRWILAGGGAAALVAAAAAGIFVLGGEPASVPEPLAVQSPLVQAPTGQSPEPGPLDDPTPTPDAAPSTPPEQLTPAPGGAPPAAPPPAPAAPAPAAPAAVGGADTGALLMRLLDRFGPPDPDAAALRTIRDSARLVLDAPQAPDAQRARAAYIMASALLPLGDTAQAAGLLERAIAWDPGNRGYNTLLNGLPAEYRSRVR